MWNKLLLLLATGLGTGYSPVAPGSMGTIVGFALVWALTPLTGWLYALTTTVFIAVSIWVAGTTRQHFGGSDPSQIVIDEIAACLVVMAGHQWTWKSALVGYAAFRLFDVWKPFPVRQAERLPGGFGIVADDLVAGVYAWLVVWLVGKVWS